MDSASPTEHDGFHPVPGGLRAVALFEATKGLVILVAGFGLLSLVHSGAQAVAEELVHHLHLNPAARYPRIFLDLAGRLTDHRLWMLAGLALLYASVRFVEAYGLWRERRWAEWFALASGGIYIPFEIYELAAGISMVKLITFAANVIVVSYIGYALARTPTGSGSG